MIILLSVDWIIIIIKNEWDNTDNHVDVDKEDARHDDNGGGWSGEWYDNYNHDLNKSMMIIIMIVITNKN